jgi:O-antigen/teichoic acid export membrane protein
VKSPEQLASYKVATIIPFAITFIPNIIVNYYYPQFVQNAYNPQLVRKLARRLSLRMFMFSFSVSLFLVLLAKPLIFLLFGSAYHDAVVPFQIISFGYWIIATFRTINGNIIAALGRAKLSFYLTGLILVVNVGLTFLMVKHYAIIGAAVAVVIMYAFSSLIGYLTLRLILSSREQP